MTKVVLYSDGGARGNPGPAAIGVVIYDETGEVLKKISQVLGLNTNNQAEYQALIAGLEAATKLGAKQVVAHLDSELVVKQMQGQYKIREAGLQELAPQVFRLMKNFDRVEFVYVPREKNKLADELVNKALDDAGF